MSFPVIAHNTEQHCGFGSELPPEEPHIIPWDSLPPVWKPLIYNMASRAAFGTSAGPNAAASVASA